MSTATPDPTEAQSDMIATLDDVAEHVAWEFDPDDWSGPGTCGFTSIEGIDGRGSFVSRVRSLARWDGVDWVYQDRNGTIRISIGILELMVRENSYRGGYDLSISNLNEIMAGPEFQRMDVQKRVHKLLLDRLRYRGYLQDARIRQLID